MFTALLIILCCSSSVALATDGSNNSPETALSITPVQTVNTSIDYQGDEDWFVVTVDHTCSIVSTITNNSGNINYGLYDSGLNKLSGNLFNTTSGKHSWKVTPGTYYIAINEYSSVNYSTSNISLTVNLREQDAYEDNDQTVNAVAITPGQTLNGIAVEARNDNDWFAVTVDHTCSIVSAITNSSGYIDYGIYDSNQVQLSAITTNSGTFTHGWKVSPGTYYIKINEWSGVRSVNYLTSTINLTVQLREEDAYENNDALSNAYQLTPGQTLSNIAIEARNDYDWYKITVDHTCSIVSTITHSSGYIDYGIYDSNQVKLSSATYSNGTHTLRWDISPGTYYIKINEYSGVRAVN